MQAHKTTSKPLDLWLLDMALTAVSFFLAYGVRVAFGLAGHVVMPLQVYLPLLIIMIPVWGIVLPVFGVYSRSLRGAADRRWVLVKAIAAAWLITMAADLIIGRMQLLTNHGSSRLILMFSLVINELLLVSYRFLLIRRQQAKEAFP